MAKLKKNIGWKGKTIKDMLLESEELFKKTGHYYGLENLALKEKDPIRYEKMFSRLRGGLVSARETSRNISASPIVKEEGELCYGLYTPEGDSIVVSTGIMVHIHTMSNAIKYMIRKNYEQAPGVADGDMFVNTDVQVGNVHTPDVQTIIPIFWKKELIGWAAGVTQELDIGAITGGAAPVGPTNTFEDGLSFPCLKMGENDTIRPDYQAFCEKSVRTPMYWKLDERTRVAGCHLIRSAVHHLIEQVGIRTYRQFIREVIEDGRRAFVSRIRELLIPGTYRHPGFMDSSWADEHGVSVLGRKDKIMHGPLELTIGGDGSFNLSFEGANGWGWHSFNCSPTAMQGAMWVLLTQTIIPNDKINDGAYLATNIKLPVGSWANPQNSITAHGHAWFYLIPAFMGLFNSLSRGFYSRGFVEEADCGYGFAGNGFSGWGIDKGGKTFAFTTFEFSCVGCGAGVVKDGLDHAAVMWNPEGDMGDVESWETLEPFLFLGRRIKPNSAGPGKFRGGSGFESLRMCEEVSYCEAQFVGEGKVFCSGGMYGGYPNASGYRHLFHDTNVIEVARKEQMYPIREGSPDESELTPLIKKGKEILDKRCITLPEEFKLGDVYMSFLRGGPGLGDSLERDPSLVIKDLDNGYVTDTYARKAYGVVTRRGKDGKWQVDEAATKFERESIRNERTQRSVPVSEWLKKARQRVVSKDVISPLKEMYAQSMNLSQRWAKEYREFWNLPENFNY
jgi:N-methylhydantoinase B/oxoprolinase/acetone carboxylase alpha subunit